MNVSNLSGGSVSPHYLSTVGQSPKSGGSQVDGGKSSRSVGSLPITSSPKTVRDEGAQQIARPSVGLRRFTGFLTGAGVALRALTAIGTLGISEGLVALGGKIYDACKGLRAAPKGDIVLTEPGTGKVVTAKSFMGPTKVPKGMTTEDITRTLQGKVDAGHNLMEQIKAGTHDGSRCTVEDMTNIMFALQVKGEALKGSFKEGAFNISDPGQKIRKFLDTCPESYQRESSHIGGFQRSDVGKHRGIDAYGNGDNMKEMLPNGMKTVLYGSMKKDDGLRMPEDRLYLKIESHGAWLTRPKGGNDESGPSRTANRHDVGAFLGHSLSFIATRGQGSAGGTFKERIPDSVKNDFRALLNDAPPEVRDLLGSDNPTESAMGMRVMYKNALDAQAKLGGDHDKFKGDLDKFIKSLETYGNLDVRIGNEIVL